MASHYNLVDYDSDTERTTNASISLENLTSAALFLTTLLTNSNIPYAIMGGFAVRLLGGTRMTRIVDIAFQAPGKLRDLWRVVEGEARLVVPDTRLICNLMKVFVWTGPGWDGCGVGVRVEVDLIESGFQSSPRDLSVNRREIIIGTNPDPDSDSGSDSGEDSEEQTIYVLEIFYLLRGKVAAFQTRQSSHDSIDIQHIVRTFTEEVRGFADQLEPDAVDVLLEHQPRWSALFGRCMR